MSLIYETQHRGGSKKEKWYEYHQDGSTITKTRHRMWKIFDGRENTWESEVEEVESWEVGDDDIPEWLLEYIQD